MVHKKLNPAVIERFKKICSEMIGIDRFNAIQYPQVKLLGRNCYVWDKYIIKSCPEIWNFKTVNEINILNYVNNNFATSQFPELLTYHTVKKRTFLLLDLLPYKNLKECFYTNKLQSFKLFPSLIKSICKDSTVILDDLKRLNIVHRDITPSNLLFDKNNSKLILIDFEFATIGGKELNPDNKKSKQELDRVTKNNLGGKYRKPGDVFSFESDKYSMDKIMRELKIKSTWQINQNPLTTVRNMFKI